MSESINGERGKDYYMVFGKIVKSAITLALFSLITFILPLQAFADGGNSLQVGTMAKSDVPSNLAYTKQTTPMYVQNASGKVVDDGIYFMASAENTQQVVAVSGNNAYLSNKSCLRSEMWVLEFSKSAQAYYVRNLATGLYLTVQGSSATDFSNVFETRKYKDKKNKRSGASSSTAKLQQWKIISTAGGHVLASAANINLYLTLNGTNAILASGGMGMQYFWLLNVYGEYFLPGGSYTLATDDGSLLTIPGYGIGDYAGFSLEANASALSQIFDIKPNTAGYYTITNVNSGKAITDVGGWFAQTDPDNKKTIKKGKKKKSVSTGVTDNQLWKAELVAGSKVRFINKQTGAVLNLGGITTWKASPCTSGLSEVAKKALKKANTRNSKTKYCIVADLTLHELFIFEKMDKSTKSGPWTLIMQTRISSGAKGSMTGAGDAKVTSKRYNHPKFNCFYWTTANGSSMHSLLYASRTRPNRITDGRLGQYISHGCIRMKISYAKWIYDNCGLGTAVSRYY